MLTPLLLAVSLARASDWKPMVVPESRGDAAPSVSAEEAADEMNAQGNDAAGPAYEAAAKRETRPDVVVRLWLKAGFARLRLVPPPADNPAARAAFDEAYRLESSPWALWGRSMSRGCQPNHEKASSLSSCRLAMKDVEAALVKSPNCSGILHTRGQFKKAIARVSAPEEAAKWLRGAVEDCRLLVPHAPAWDNTLVECVQWLRDAGLSPDAERLAGKIKDARGYGEDYPIRYSQTCAKRR